jgi:hypothetical protein
LRREVKFTHTPAELRPRSFPGTWDATPAGWENYMRDLAEAAQSVPLTPEVFARIASRYDFEFTG